MDVDDWTNVEDVEVVREGDDIELRLLDLFGDVVSRIKFPAAEWGRLAQQIVRLL